MESIETSDKKANAKGALPHLTRERRTVERTLEIDISVKSAKDCDCNNKSLSVSKTQLLKARNGVPQWEMSYFM